MFLFPLYTSGYFTASRHCSPPLTFDAGDEEERATRGRRGKRGASVTLLHPASPLRGSEGIRSEGEGRKGSYRKTWRRDGGRRGREGGRLLNKDQVYKEMNV